MFVNPSYQSLVLRQVSWIIANNGGQPLTVGALKSLQAKPNPSDESASVVNFLTNFFTQISGIDGDPNSISVNDINGISRKELQLDLNG